MICHYIPNYINPDLQKTDTFEFFVIYVKKLLWTYTDSLSDQT